MHNLSVRLFCTPCDRHIVTTLHQPMSINPQPETVQCPTCGLAFSWPSVEKAIHKAAALYNETGEEWGTHNG